ncbi:MAG: glycosyltransferase family 2 protein [Chloroflexota bacterium]|nr:glycosyltransferase family 2 protein [Chloroflexota bacterium]
MDEVKLSIIMTTYNARSVVEHSLASLEAQTIRKALEVIVVDSSTDGTAELVAERFPAVQLYRFTQRKYCGDARNVGIAHARSNLIAFLDADCIADPTWAAEIIAAHHQAPHPLIGGTVDNANPQHTVGWAHYFCEFSAWMPGSPQQEVEEVPGCALSLKRWAFERYGPFLMGRYCSDSALHWKMARDGHQPLLAPSIRIAHTNIEGLRAFLAHEVQHGRHFGTVRCQEQNFSLLKKGLYALLSPLLPVLLFWRSARRIVRKHIYRQQFWRVAPLVLLGQSAWAYGEFLGYVASLRGGTIATDDHTTATIEERRSSP